MCLVSNVIVSEIRSCRAEEDAMVRKQQKELERGVCEINTHIRDVITRARQVLKIDCRPVRTDKLLERIKLELTLACSEEVENHINILRRLVDSDILWDKVIEVKEVHNKEQFVYDLTVNEHHTFIANNMIVHNTSALNGIVALIPPFQRVISIEDTRELSLPSYQWNWVPLATRLPNPEGTGEVKMLDLLINSLRMRPDRIVMGEIRRKQEAEVLFEAMHTGHSVYATMHADTAAQLIKRLIEPPIEVPASEVEDVHLMLVQYRDRRRNLRRTLEICEVIPGAGRPELNYLYRWNARTDIFQTVKPPHRYSQQLNLHTGMTDKEINQDIQNKMKVLQWMTEQKLTEVEDVGRVMKTYYSNEQVVIQAAEKKQKSGEVL
jgi:flagellar protein FlaI